MRPLFLLFLLSCSLSAFAAGLDKIAGTTSESNCFKGPFETYESWVSMLSKNPRFSIDKFPFSKQEFDHYRATLDCSTFNYDVDGVKVQGYIIAPNNVEGPLPTIIYNRGGNTHFGRVNMGKMMYNLMPLAAKGFVVIGSQYRWSGKRYSPDKFVADGSEDQFGGVDVNDVLALIPIIEQLDIADNDRIGVYGSSRGGMQSFLFAKRYLKIKAMAIVSGISDVFSFRDRSDKTRFLLSKLIPNYASEEEAALKARSAIYWAEELPKVPTLLIHAKDDEKVAYSNATEIAEKMYANNIPHELLSFESGGHNLTGHQQQVTEKIVGWFKQHLSD